MWLMCWTAEKDPRQGNPLSAWMGGAIEKNRPKRPSDHQLQEAQKKHSDRAITPVMEAVPASLHIWRHQGPHKPNSCITFTRNSHWAELSRAKKKSCVYACRVALVVSNSLQPCGLPGFSVRDVLQARILEHIGQYWLPYTSRALYFLLP